MILYDSNKHIVDSFLFEDTSINTVTSKSFYIVSENELSDINITMKNNNEAIQLFDFIDGGMVVVDSLVKDNLEHNTAQNIDTTYHIYKFDVLFDATKKGSYINDGKYLSENVCTVIYDGIEEIFTLKGYSIDINDRLEVALSNKKITFDADYYKAMFFSDIKKNDVDHTLMNTKKREFLMEIMNITGFVGSYKSLIDAIKFFGWGELLEIKEFWKSLTDDTTKLTSIKNEVLDKIDKSLSSFKKTKNMALVYQINKIDGYDSDGLPLYNNILYDTMDVITKLYAMERVIERDFLTTNTEITSIIGNFNAVIGTEFICWLNGVRMLNFDVSEDRKQDITIDINKKVVMSNHRVLVNPYAYIPDHTDPNKLVFIDGINRSVLSEQYFNIERLLNGEEVDLENYDILTRYVNSDFGLLNLDVTLNKDLYSEYYYEVYKDNSFVFKSERNSISKFNGHISTGVKEVGVYNINIVFIDHYGGASFIGADNIEVVNKEVSFDIAQNVYDNLDDVDKYERINLYSSFEIDNGDSYSVDPIDDTTPLQYYSTDFDRGSIYTSVKNLKNLSINDLGNTPMSAYGTKYGKFIVDIIGDKTTGTRKLGLKQFENKPYDYMTLFYDSLTYTNDAIFIQKCVHELNKKGGVYDNFTYDIIKYCNDPLGDVSDARYMLLCKTKRGGDLASKYFFDMRNDFCNSDFTDCYISDDILSISNIDSQINIFINDLTYSSDLIFEVGSDRLFLENINIDSINELFSILDTYIKSNDISHKVSIFNNIDHVTICSKENIMLSHIKLNYHKDVVRGNDFIIKKTKKGSDFSLGSLVYAFIDESSKIINRDIKWTLKDALNNDIITTQNAYCFRYIMLLRGCFSLELEVTDEYGTTITESKGCFVVK